MLTNLLVHYDLCVGVPISCLLTMVGAFSARDCEIFANTRLKLFLVPDLGRQVQRPVHLHRLAERETFWHAVESPFVDKGSNDLNNEL